MATANELAAAASHADAEIDELRKTASSRQDRVAVDRALEDLTIKSDKEGWHGLARQAAEFWSNRRLPESGHFSKQVQAATDEVTSHPKGPLPYLWTEVFHNEELAAEYHDALYHKEDNGEPLNVVLDRPHPDSDEDELVNYLEEGNNGDKLHDLRFMYIKRSHDPDAEDVKHWAIDTTYDPGLDGALDDWQYTVGVEHGSGELPDDASDYPGFFPNMTPPPVKDAKTISPKSQPPSNDMAELRAALPKGVSPGQSGYSSRYGG